MEEEVNVIRQLAVDIDQFSFDFDTYGYWNDYGDKAADREESIQSVTNDIWRGEAEYLQEFLREVINNGD